MSYVVPEPIMSPLSQPDPIWKHPPDSYALEPDAVHVWRIALSASPPDAGSAWSVLSPDEYARARRFFFEPDRSRYVISHRALRLLLGRYLGVEPAAITFRRGDHGKPALDNDADLRFNLSTSHQMALLAVTTRREVGIDIEYEREDFADKDAARRFFSPREIAALNTVPPEMYTEAFFNCWTRKEAYIKAIGLGLSMPLDQFSVSLRPGEPAQLLEVIGQPGELERWSMSNLEPGESYAAALVVEGSGWTMCQYDWVG
jgi:4'-phosphopantetheinyl transferase